MIITPQTYNGDLIHQPFAYQIFRKNVLPIGNIVSFVGPADVTTNLIDLEDKLANDYIYSEKMVHFCWEIPDGLLTKFGAVAHQRLLNTGIANILHKYIQKPIEVDGDDIMVHAEFIQRNITQNVGKASVSIVHQLNGVTLGHTGINITAGEKAPGFAYSTKLTDEQATKFQNEVIKFFYELQDDMFIATTKVIV